jgi:ATP-dependent helicase/nuclease subunit B
MSLRLIYGRAGSGKSSFCLSEIKRELEAGEAFRHIIIVPEQFSFQAEKRLIKTLGASGINGVEVLSFGRMAYRVFGEVGGLSRKHINPAGRSILVYLVMKSIKEELRVFSKAAGQKGFVNTLCNTISELKRYNTAPHDIRQLEVSSESGPLADKLHDIALIYEEFEKRLHSNYIDTDDDLALLAEKLEHSTLLDGVEIWVDEFSGFTPQEYKVIEKLIAKAGRVNVSLCTDCLADDNPVPETDPFLPSKSASAKLRRIAAEANVQVEPPIEMASSSSFCRLARMSILMILGGLYEETRSCCSFDPCCTSSALRRHRHADQLAGMDCLYDRVSLSGLQAYILSTHLPV